MNAPAGKGSRIKYVKTKKANDRSGNPDKENIKPGLIRGAQKAKIYAGVPQSEDRKCTSQGGP